MRVAGQVNKRPGVHKAAAFMGTAANHALLAQAALATPEIETAAAEDLILAVAADGEEIAEAALAEARELLLERRKTVAESSAYRPHTLESALRHQPNANLVTISVPGSFAKFEAMRALRRDLHVFIFSDNVPLEDEVELKREAAKRGLLCMGPDCGTAYIGGTGLGFFNAVPKGRVGCVAASGTGLQAVASRLATLGEGLSHGIGVGSRDLSAEVGGLMTFRVIDALASDPATEAIVVISKPPHPKVAARLELAVAGVGKPVVVCAFGATIGKRGGALWVAGLDEAAEATVALLKGADWAPKPFGDSDAVRRRLMALRPNDRPVDGRILGLYTGGTLAHDAALALRPLIGPVMIDPQTRTEVIDGLTPSSNVGVLILDLVLGRGAAEDPAAPLAQSISALRERYAAAGKDLAVVASVVGTEFDPQGLANQIARLTAAGIHVFPSNAEAARFAALLIKPDLTGQILEVSP
jgi:FdrA protein